MTDRSKTFNHQMYLERKARGNLEMIEGIQPPNLSLEERIKWANENTPRYETFQEWQKRMCKG